VSLDRCCRIGRRFATPHSLIIVQVSNGLDKQLSIPYFLLGNKALTVIKITMARSVLFGASLSLFSFAQSIRLGNLIHGDLDTHLRTLKAVDCLDFVLFQTSIIKHRVALFFIWISRQKAERKASQCRRKTR